MVAFPVPDAGVAPADRQLVLRAVISACLGRYCGQTRLHTESDLRFFLRWYADHDLDPPASAAYFTTAGQPLYATVNGFIHGGFTDWGLKMGATIFVGDPATPPQPTRDWGVRPSLTSFSVDENQFVAFTLPAGRYWLAVTNLANVDLLSCTPDPLTAQPAPPPLELTPAPTTDTTAAPANPRTRLIRITVGPVLEHRRLVTVAARPRVEADNSRPLGAHD